MLGEGGTALAELEEAVHKFQAREDRRVDLKGLRVVTDALEAEFSAEARNAQLGRDNLLSGSATAVTWISRLCGMSATSVADPCVGKQLESLAKIGEALRTGEISYQSASVLCHLREQLGDKRELFVEDEMLEHARNLSVASLRYLCRYARHVADPDGFFNQAEADYTLRRLDISQMGDGMFCVDAILDPEGGAALKTALGSLAKRLGPDERSHKQKDGRLLNRARAPWSRGGPTHLSNLVLLCFFHHRLVHEGGWQVVQVGHEFRFVPPDRVVFQRARAPGLRWAA